MTAISAYSPRRPPPPPSLVARILSHTRNKTQNALFFLIVYHLFNRWYQHNQRQLRLSELLKDYPAVGKRLEIWKRNMRYYWDTTHSYDLGSGSGSGVGRYWYAIMKRFYDDKSVVDVVDDDDCQRRDVAVVEHAAVPIDDDEQRHKDCVPLLRIHIIPNGDNDKKTNDNDDEEQQPLSNGSSSSNHHNPSPSLSLLRHREDIDSVLNYWFPSQPIEKTQKSLWMITNPVLRRTMDEEIAIQFGPLFMKLISNPNLRREWCGDGIDNDIDNNTTEKGEEADRNRFCVYGWEGCMAFIIIMDQFSRHIRRYCEHISNDNNNNNKHSDLNAKLIQLFEEEETLMTKLNNVSLSTSTYFQSQFKHLLTSGRIPTVCRVFALMPYRHANTLEHVHFVRDCIGSQFEWLEMEEGLCKSFRNATIRRLNGLLDDDRRHGHNNEEVLLTNGGNREMHHDQIAPNTVPQDMPSSQPNGISTTITANNHTYSDNDILDHFPFHPSLEVQAAAQNHAVVNCLRQFLDHLGIPRVNNTTNNHNKNKGSPRRGKKDRKTASTPPRTNQSQPQPQPQPVIISLSGGVDSMVIASCLSHISNPNSPLYSHSLTLISAHIDYANRPESANEANYVKKYSESMLSIQCQIKRVEEITRGITARDEYESLSRSIRYSLYKSIIADCSTNNNTNIINVGVMLGHHKGDLRENVLSNACRGCGPLELSGMEKIGLVEGVNVWRPLLDLEKDVVFDFAHLFGVPYFKDTTPHWSTRGKLRNNLLPLLSEIYGDGCHANLSHLAIESDSAKHLMTERILKPFFATVLHYPMGISFETNEWKHMGMFFWKFVLKEVLHSGGRGMFSDKSVQSFLERISKHKCKGGWLQCKRDYAVYLQSDGRVFVFHPESFPWAKKDAYSVDRKVLSPPYNKENTIQIGPWIISAHHVTTSHENNESSSTPPIKLLSKKAILNMEDLMKGHFYYVIKIPKHKTLDVEDTQPNPSSYHLKVRKGGFTRTSRPEAWKGIDIKIEGILPLLANCEDGLNFLEDPWSEEDRFDFVRVDYILDSLVQKKDGHDAKHDLVSNEGKNDDIPTIDDNSSILPALKIVENVATEKDGTKVEEDGHGVEDDGLATRNDTQNIVQSNADRMSQLLDTLINPFVVNEGEATSLC